jgi:hypothetical protein
VLSARAKPLELLPEHVIHDKHDEPRTDGCQQQRYGRQHERVLPRHALSILVRVEHTFTGGKLSCTGTRPKLPTNCALGLLSILTRRSGSCAVPKMSFGSGPGPGPICPSSSGQGRCPESRKLMSKHFNRFTPAALQASLETRQTRADERAANVASLIAALQAAGVTKLQGIAAALNERGVPTPSGHRHWRPMQVSRLLKRLAD